MTTACRGSVYQKGDLKYPCSVVWNCLNSILATVATVATGFWQQVRLNTCQLLIAAFVWSAGRVCFFPPHKNPIDTG